jgi:hypothetical protein
VGKQMFRPYGTAELDKPMSYKYFVPTGRVTNIRVSLIIQEANLFIDNIYVLHEQNVYERFPGVVP